MKFLVSTLLILVTACQPVPSRTGNPTQRTTSNQTASNETTTTDTTLPIGSSFETRLYPYLAISGNKCVGNETILFSGNTFYCEIDQWIVIVDNQNTCDQNVCTNISVDQLIAKLEENTGIRTTQYRYFDMIPLAGARARQRQILRDVYLRANRNGDLSVISKYFN